MNAIVVANGRFPDHSIPLKALATAQTIVCCDGGVINLINYGLSPTAIVGDLDSLSQEHQRKYADRLYHYPDQDTNDLTKSIVWCISNGFTSISIVGATGLREDHTLGNIGLLASYARRGADVKLLTDHGQITPMLSSGRIESYPGQTVSFFVMGEGTHVTSRNLKYPLNNTFINELWMGTLNESTDTWFELSFKGEIVVFRGY